ARRDIARSSSGGGRLGGAFTGAVACTSSCDLAYRVGRSRSRLYLICGCRYSDYAASELVPFDAVLAQLLPQRRAVDAEHRGGLRLLPLAQLEHAEDVRPLELVERR